MFFYAHGGHGAVCRQEAAIRYLTEKWGERRDSNPRPLEPQSNALTS